MLSDFAMLLLTRRLSADVLLCAICLLLGIQPYGNLMLLSVYDISAQKSVNFTFGNNSYLLMNNQNGNLEVLPVSDAEVINMLDKRIDSNNNKDAGDLLKDFTVPIAVAIIGGLVASWNFIQTRWNGNRFQKLILRELGEVIPSEPDKRDGKMSSYMKKKFIHKEMLGNLTENKDFIFSIDSNLIHLTKQLWNAFDNNYFEQFIEYLCRISKGKKSYTGWPYDKNKRIECACKEWIKFFTNNTIPTLPKECSTIKDLLHRRPTPKKSAV